MCQRYYYTFSWKKRNVGLLPKVDQAPPPPSHSRVSRTLSACFTWLEWQAGEWCEQVKLGGRGVNVRLRRDNELQASACCKPTPPTMEMWGPSPQAADFKSQLEIFNAILQGISSHWAANHAGAKYIMLFPPSTRLPEHEKLQTESNPAVQPSLVL